MHFTLPVNFYLSVALQLQEQAALHSETTTRSFGGGDADEKSKDCRKSVRSNAHVSMKLPGRCAAGLEWPGIHGCCRPAFRCSRIAWLNFLSP
jgi:hypothetical protein